MPNQVQVNYTTTVNEETRKRMSAPLTGDDADILVMGVGGLMPEQGGVLAGHPSLDKEKYRNIDDTQYHDLPYVNNTDTSTRLWRIPEGVDFASLLADYGRVTEAAEKVFAQQLGPGDEPLKELADAVMFNPAKLVLKGWNTPKLLDRVNAAGWIKEFSAYINGGVSEEARRKFAWGDAHFPINRLCVSMDKIVQTHVNYFDKADSGTITAEEERNFRQTLLEEEIRALHHLNRVATHTDPAEGEEIKELLDRMCFGDQKSDEKPAPIMAVICPRCGATTLPNEHGCCEYCGGAVN